MPPRTPRGFIRRFSPVVVVASLAACHRAGPGPVEGGEVRAVEVNLGAANGALLACDLEPRAAEPGAPAKAACKPLARGETVALPVRLKSTRGARARVDLGGGAALDLAGEASVIVSAGATRRVTIEQGAVTVGEAHDLEVAVLDHLAKIGAAPSTLSVLASAADRATVTVRRGGVELTGASGAPVALATGDTRRIRLGEAPDPKEISAAPAPPPRPFEGERAPVTPRGFGSLAARVPGTTATVGGVRLASHKVAVTIREGFARTEVEEEFANDTARVLEGTYKFPVPPGSSLSRLALWVGKELVEGEVVERERAARIFKGIVDDTVRPRDPALLEWTQGGAFSLKIFPIPAHGARKVILAYDQALPERGGRTRYVYPMSLGADQAVAADAFAITVTASDPSAPITEVMTPGYPAAVATEERKIVATWSADKLVPDGDFELSFQRGEGRPAAIASYAPRDKEFAGDDGRAFAAVRVRVDPLEGAALPKKTRLDRAIVVDASHSQSNETFADEARLAIALLDDLGPEERFVVLACDSACASFPDDGLAKGGKDSAASAAAFLAGHKPGGSSDLAGALLEASRRLAGSTAAQAVVLGDGQPTSGELSAASIAARVKPAFDRAGVDLRLFGTGRTVDEVTLGGIARALGGVYERVADGQALAVRGQDLALGLRRPVVVDAKITLPTGFSDPVPSSLPSLRVGEEVTILARANADAAKGEVKLEGKLGGAPYAIAHAIELAKDGAFQNPLVPRLWAEARIGELEASNEKPDADEVIALSKRFHVASRRTSLLVLENDRMFAAYGVERTTKNAGDQSDHVFGALGGSPLASSPVEVAAPLANADPRAPVAPWGEIGLLRNNEPLSARGNMWGAEAGDSFGKGGLGLSGVGEGGGGRGEGIGLGRVGTIGHGSSGAAPSKGAGESGNTGSGQGFGSAQGRLGGSHRSSAPQVRMGATMVSGRIPPEVIQRIVRQNFGRFRLCYENGLKRNEKLAGRVSVRFVIGRDGSVPVASNGGSDLPDPDVVNCVVAAFRGLSFPQPDAGSVTVTYPIQFSSDGTKPVGPPQAWAKAPPERPKDIWPLRPEEEDPKPTASHKPGDEAWRSADDVALAKARAEAAADVGSRQKRERLVRALLAHGRFDEALVTAEAFAEADPDLALAGELVAEARAAAGDGPGALAAVDAAAESAPASVTIHARAARALEASGDERRACAHWRSLAELRPTADADVAQALRCRARVLGDKEGALADAKAVDKPGPALAKLVAALEGGAAPAFADAGAQGAMVAKLACAEGTERCGTLVVITPRGSVLSPWTPGTWRAGPGEIGIGSLVNGTYRTRLVGAPASAKATVTMRALGSEKKFDVDATSAGATIASTAISNIEWGS